MVYILAINPLILAPAAVGYTFSELFTATALASFISCLLMGLYARFPVALAPGMSLNVFLSYTICQGMGFSYEQGLLIVFISGAMFLIATVCGMREKMVAAIPMSLKVAVSAGIGLFIIVIALFNTGIVVHGTATTLDLGDFTDPGVLLAIFCILVTICLWYRGKWYDVILGLVLTWIVGIILFQMGFVSDVGTLPDISQASVVSTPDLGLFGKVFTGFEMFPSSLWAAFIGALVSMFVVDMFDTTGTLLAVKDAITDDVKDEDSDMSAAMKVDSVASMFGAIAGTSTTTSYLESFTGIKSGARAGLMAVVVGLLFIVAMFFSGIFSTVTAACTAGALFLVGMVMMNNIRRIEWGDSVLCFSSLIIIIMMGLTESITDGIGIGIIFYVIGYLALGRRKEIGTPMWFLFFIFLAYFVITTALA